VECALGDPKPIWVHGIGPYAVIASCGEDWHYRRLVRGGTVLLRKTEAEAPRHLVQIDDTACGGNCRRDHEIVRVEFQG